MSNSRTLAWLAVACSACLTACANPGIVEVSPDQYMLARKDPGGLVGNSAALKARMIKDANAFAEKQGKRAVPVPLGETPGWPTCDPQLIEYHFRIVDPQQAAAPAASKVQRVDRLADGILRLDQLRRQGLLSEGEFQGEKQRLLQAN
jgi:hypothetical protein